MGYKRGNESDLAATVAHNLTNLWIIARSQPEQFSWQSKGWQAKGSPQNPGNVKDGGRRLIRSFILLAWRVDY